jgi:branched-chain amino acid transport system substrate-binding protein
MRISRLAVLVSLAVFLVVTLAPAGPPPAVAQGGSAAPIKIGYLAPLTGPFADPGKDMEIGTRLALKKLGNRAAGRPIELVVEDTAANPDTGLSKARRLVEQAKVDMLMGVYHGGVAMAVAFYAKEKKVPLVISAGGGAQPVMYEVKPQPYVFRASHSIRGMQMALGYHAASALGHKRAVSMSWDYVAGRDGVDGFTAGFEAGGGKVIKKIFFKLGTPDFSPFFTGIPSEADVVHTLVTGADAVRFIRQFAELGYKDKLPLLADALGVSDRFLPQIGDAAIGIVSNATYAVSWPTPGNREFVEAYTRETGGKPGIEAAYSYANMLFVAKAIEAAGGGVNDVPRFLAALRDTAGKESIRGSFSFNAMNDIVFPVEITRIVKEGGVLKHTTLKTYERVDALWKPGK